MEKSRVKMLLLTNKYSFCIFILFLCVNIHTSNGLRILGLFPLNFKSHFITCGELMRGLAAKGHKVDVYSHFPFEEKIPNLRQFDLTGTIPITSNNITFEETRQMTGINMFNSKFNEIQENTCKLMENPIFQELFEKPPNSQPYDLIITEVCGIYCYLPWGRHFNAPVIGVLTTPLLEWHYEPLGNPLNLAYNTCQHCPFTPPMTFFQKLNNFVQFNFMLHVFKNFLKSQDMYIKKFFGPDSPRASDFIKNISLILANEDIVSSGVKSYTPAIVPIGGLHVVDRNKTLPQIVQNWLDKSTDGCIYVSFGSMVRIETFPRHLIDAFYKSFSDIAPVRVLMKIAKPEQLPPGLPVNVLTQSWFNQIQILKHKNIKAFVTHGGLMGAQEALYFGIPLVGVPLFGDQLNNVAQFVKRKIAIKVDVDEITDEIFTQALNEAIYNETFRETVKQMSEKFKDRPMSPMDTAIYWVEYIHRYGKDALRSPIRDIPWWQASLLDVYAFIITAVILFLYVMIRVKKILATVIYTKLRPERRPLIVKVKMN